MSNGLGGNAFTRKIWFDLEPRSRSHEALPSTSCDLFICKVRICYGQWLRRCIAKKINYLTLTPRSRDQGHTKCCPVPSTSHELCTSEVWCCYIPWLRRRCIYKKIHYLTLNMGSRSHKMLPSTLNIMWPMQQQSLILIYPMVKWKMHSGQGHTKCCPMPSTSFDLSTYRVLSYFLKRFRRRYIYKKIQ